ATGSRWWFGLPVPASLPYLSDQLPTAFLISSAEDMTHYLIAHNTNGSYLGTHVLSVLGMTNCTRLWRSSVPRRTATFTTAWDGSLVRPLMCPPSHTMGTPPISTPRW